MTPPTLALFPDLPAELRDQIWHHALPRSFAQALYLYRKGCWQPRRLAPDDPEYDPINADLNLNYEFHHALLYSAQVSVPIFSVCREARAVARAWMRDHGFRVRHIKSGGLLIFTRDFDPRTDVLYVPRDRWDDFVREPFDRQFEPDLLDRNMGCPPPRFTRVAIAEGVLRNEQDPLPELFDWYHRLEDVYVVRGDDAVRIREDHEARVQAQSGLDGVSQRCLVWDGGDEKFAWRGRDQDGGDSCRELNRVVEEKTRGDLVGKLVEHGPKRFQIQQALVVSG